MNAVRAVLSRLPRALVTAGVVAAGLASIVGSTSSEPAPVVLLADCRNGLTLSADANPVVEGGPVTLTVTLQNTHPSAGAPGWDLEYLAQEPGGTEHVVHTATASVDPGQVLHRYRIDPVVFRLQDGTRYRVHGAYRCPGTASGSGHETSNTIDLHVTAGAPAWITQPASTAVDVAAAATFSALAFGDNDYQWQRSSDGFVTALAITGATDTRYVLPAAQSTDNGALFRLRATSRTTGQVIVSDAATLTVNAVAPPPGFSFTVNNQFAVDAGANSLVTGTAVQTGATAGTLTFFLRDAPAGIGLVAPATALPGNTAGTPVELKFTAAGNVAALLYQMQLDVLLDGVIKRSIPLFVTVRPAGTGLAVTSNVANVNLTVNQPVHVILTLTPVAGSAGTVTLRPRGAPSGLGLDPLRTYPVTATSAPFTSDYLIVFPATVAAGHYDVEFVASEGDVATSVTVGFDRAAAVVAARASLNATP